MILTRKLVESAEASDSESIMIYLAYIAKYGSPGFDMGHWSDFVNRITRLSQETALLRNQVAELVSALNTVLSPYDAMGNFGGSDYGHNCVAIVKAKNLLARFNEKPR